MKKRILLILIISALTLALLSACSARDSSSAPSDSGESITANEFNEITELGFSKVAEEPVSVFRLSVNSAAYSNLRGYINQGYTINKNQIRIEEIVNYFRYDYASPEEGKALAMDAKLYGCPWNEDAHLLRVGVKAEDIQTDGTRNNLVFLLDVSGSMSAANRLPLVQQSFNLLLDTLGENDTVSIVTYAGRNQVLLSGGSGAQKPQISAIINNLSAGGSTAGADGINTAYQLAEQYFVEGGNNRVILATDGDFNVGVSTQNGLKNLISEKRESGIYLSVLGFGYGNLKDNKLETLANNGNGNYAYIDTIQEARKVLVEEIGGTLNVVARDAKARVEFNPAKVDSYRLLGYENLMLTQDQWEDTSTDSGEIGSGFTVTAVYEVILADDPEAESTMEDHLLNVQIRYQSPNLSDTTEYSEELYADAADITDFPDEDMKFISAVIETCLVLRQSIYKGTSNLDNALARLNALDCVVSDPYRAEFKTLVEKLIANYDY